MLQLQVDYGGSSDFDEASLPRMWSPTPRVAASQSLLDALHRQTLWSKPSPGSVDPAGLHGAAVCMVEVPAGSDEFRAVAGLFLSAYVPDNRAGAAADVRACTGVLVESVRRVENHTLQRIYMARREHVAWQVAACGGRFDCLEMERWLFHGPGPDSNAKPGLGDPLACIAACGFAPLLSGSRVGAMYGQGAPPLPPPRNPGPAHALARARVWRGAERDAAGAGTYLARDSSLSDRYARSEWDGSWTVIMASTVTPTPPAPTHPPSHPPIPPVRDPFLPLPSALFPPPTTPLSP